MHLQPVAFAFLVADCSLSMLALVGLTAMEPPVMVHQKHKVAQMTRMGKGNNSTKDVT